MFQMLYRAQLSTYSVQTIPALLKVLNAQQAEMGARSDYDVDSLCTTAGTSYSATATSLGSSDDDGDYCIILCPSFTNLPRIVQNGCGRPSTDSRRGAQPTHITQWLGRFEGSEVSVAANGQWDFLALYATLSNHGTKVLSINTSNMKQASEI
ncbi:hypothetical protein PHMEG_00018436 [Phytophthora megakarya]|uniref:Uncharacterized protein n=1 Tax=Phytophthora megakarya TaxID=4795 RepID=A0A225VUE1_9STRA|nr:hypothetical protein PHMEG_00018436 [Phytophthora megakarya]